MNISSCFPRGYFHCALWGLCKERIDPSADLPLRVAAGRDHSLGDANEPPSWIHDHRVTDQLEHAQVCDAISVGVAFIELQVMLCGQRLNGTGFFLETEVLACQAARPLAVARLQPGRADFHVSWKMPSHHICQRLK